MKELTNTQFLPTMDGDMWLAFQHKGCYEGCVLGDYFYNYIYIYIYIYIYNIFPSYQSGSMFFHVSFWGRSCPKKEKKSPGLSFGPTRKKTHNLEKQDAS